MKEASGEAAEKQAVAEEAAKQSQNSTADQLATAAEKQAEAQDEARQAAEQTAREKQAAEDASLRAQEAEKARQAAQQAPESEKEKALSAAEEAQRQAGFAAELASKEKQSAEETAKRAAERLTTAEEEINAARMAAEQAAANNPLAPTTGTGLNPLPAGAGGGVLGEAKSWMGVPYDYSHMAGQTRKAVDCSAFTAAVYSKFGIMLPDSPIGQLGMGAPVSGPPKAGDLVFFSEDGSGTPTHVGIANGDGTITHSSSFTGEVSVTDMDYINGYMGARRLL